MIRDPSNIEYRTSNNGHVGGAFIACGEQTGEFVSSRVSSKARTGQVGSVWERSYASACNSNSNSRDCDDARGQYEQEIEDRDRGPELALRRWALGPGGP